MATGLDGRHRDKDGRIDEKRGDTLVRTLRKEYGEDFLRGRRSDTKLSTIREQTGKSLTELVQQHKGAKQQLRSSMPHRRSHNLGRPLH